RPHGRDPAVAAGGSRRRGLHPKHGRVLADGTRRRPVNGVATTVRAVPTNQRDHSRSKDRDPRAPEQPPPPPPPARLQPPSPAPRGGSHRIGRRLPAQGSILGSALQFGNGGCHRCRTVTRSGVSCRGAAWRGGGTGVCCSFVIVAVFVAV